MASYKFCGISIISIKTDVSYVPVFFYTIISTSHYINRRADQQFSYKLCRSKRELSTRTGLLRRIELSPISLADDLIDLQFDFSDNNRVCDCSGHNVCGPEHLNQLIKPVNNRSQLPAVYSYCNKMTSRPAEMYTDGVVRRLCDVGTDACRRLIGSFASQLSGHTRRIARRRRAKPTSPYATLYID